MKNRILSVFIALVFSFCLTGCQPNSDKISPPDDGWTEEELIGMVRIDGKPITRPLTLDGLIEILGEENCQVDKKSSFIHENGEALVALKYKDEILLDLNYVGITDDNIDNISDKEINVFITNNVYTTYNDIITINGVSTKSSLNDIIVSFGNPDFKTDYDSLIYCDKNTLKSCIEFFINRYTEEDDKVISGIAVFL